MRFIPNYPNFKPLEISDLETIAKRLSAFAPQICEHSLANYYIWQDFDNPKVTLINNNLCFLIQPATEPAYFLEPLGSHQLQETVEVCLKHTGLISRISEKLLSLLPSEKYHVSPLRDHFDYLYLTKTLSELKGRNFDGKRNHIKKFLAKCPDCQYLPLTAASQADALGLFEKWFKLRKKTGYFQRLAYHAQKNALRRAFEDYEKLSLFGGGFFSGNELRGYTIGSRLNAETAAVHFHYGDPHFPGVSPALHSQACQKTFAHFKFVNLEQDLGIPGLRKSKLSYHPIRLEKKFKVELKA